MTFGDLLEERKDAIVGRWGDAVLSAYPDEGAALLRAQKDPFANPLGHSVREGTRGIFQAILGEVDQEALREALDKIVRIRAVQELPPTEALSFVFSLRAIVREVVPESEDGARHREDLREMDRKIDGVALTAFDLYSERREELSRLRINEVKRQVAWVFEKMNQRAGGGEEAGEDPANTPSAHENVKREDL